MEEIKLDKHVLVDKVELANLQLQLKSYNCARKLIPFEPIEHEIWKPIPKSNYYFVSNLGRIRKDFTFKNGVFSQRILTPVKTNGKLFIEIRPTPDNRIRYQVHNLVALEFLTTTGARGKTYRKDLRRMKVTAKDGDYSNVCVDNLFWQSRKRNKRKKPVLNKVLEYINAKGEKVKKFSVVSTEDCIEILKLRQLGISQSIIANRFKITQQMVSSVIRGKINEE